MEGTKNVPHSSAIYKNQHHMKDHIFSSDEKLLKQKHKCGEFTRLCRTHKLPKILFHWDILKANQHLVSTTISCALTKGICSPLQHKLCTWGEDAPGSHSSSISLTLSYKYVVSKCQDPLGRAFLAYSIRSKQKALRFFQFICFH